jgi:hypothetical protein
MLGLEHHYHRVLGRKALAVDRIKSKSVSRHCTGIACLIVAVGGHPSSTTSLSCRTDREMTLQLSQVWRKPHLFVR